MKTNKKEYLWHIPLLIAVFVQLWPIVFMISTSLKDMDQIFQATLNPLPIPPTMANYTTVLEDFPLFTYIYNRYCCRNNGDESNYKRFGCVCVYLLRF